MFFYLTTILTMLDNVIIVSAIDAIAPLIVDHCQTLSFKQQGSLCFFI